MRIGIGRLAVDWGHLALLAAIVGLTTWYLLDARSVSLSINNLLLVQPTALFVLGMALLTLPQCFRSRERAETQPSDETSMTDAVKVTAIVVALGAFVFLIDVIGFDASMVLFVLATMIVCGERHPLPLIVYPVAVTLLLVSGFKLMMPYPMTTLVL
jgi:hypothetical protein